MNIYKHIIIHQKLSTSTQEQRMLISYDGQYYEVSQGIIELVEVLQQHETESEAITFYCEKKKGKYTPEQVKGIIDKFVIPLFTPKISKRSFLYEKELFSAQAIDKFSYAFRFLFYHWYMLAVLIIALILDICFFVHTPDLLLFNNKVNIYMIIGLFAFILGSSFCA